MHVLKAKKVRRQVFHRSSRSEIDTQRLRARMYVPEAASTNSPLMKSLVYLISGTTTPAAALPLPLQPLPAIDDDAS